MLSPRSVPKPTEGLTQSSLLERIAKKRDDIFARCRRLGDPLVEIPTNEISISRDLNGVLHAFIDMTALLDVIDTVISKPMRS